MSILKKIFQGTSKKEEKIKAKANSTILGMILLEELNSLDIDNVISELKNKWDLKIGNVKSDNGISIFDVNGYTISIANIPVPIPGDEVEEAVKYNYFWENGVDEVSKHKGHIIISIVNAGKNPVQENLLYSKIVSSVMNSSKAIGIYIGGRTLVLKKEFYLENIKMMSNKNLPLYIWIYFSLRKENGKQSIYTYGLADFGKMEMEILDSNHPMSELNEMMFNLAHYVVLSDITLKNGETIGMSETQKLCLNISKGKYLDGETIKIEY